MRRPARRAGWLRVARGAGKEWIRLKKWNRLQLLSGVCALLLSGAALLPMAAFGEPTGTPAKPETTVERVTATARPSAGTASPAGTGAPAAGTENGQGDAKKEPEQTADPRIDAQGKPILGQGETGILIEAGTGTVLFDADSQKRMFPASTTKIMTALVAMEALEAGEAALTDQVEITAAMLDGLDPDSSNMELVEGEVISFEHLLQGLLIPSGNDAAMAIAFRIAGSPEAYVERMNAKAAALGLKDTHFVNPHGLHDEDHYTTAADMAVMARAAMGYETFRDIVDIAHIKMPPTNKREKQRYYINTNGLLSTMRYTGYYYKGSTGIKTGRTTEAGNCLVSSAQKNGMELIGVVFGGKEVGDSHLDTIRMLNYGFDNFESIQAVSKGEILGEIRVKQGKAKDTVTLSAGGGVAVIVPKGTEKDALEIRMNVPDALYAPLTKGQEVATVSILHQGQELGTGLLCADVDIERSVFWPVLALGEWLWSMTVVRILVYLFLAAIAVFVFIMIAGLRKELKRARMQKRRRNRQNRGK